MKVVMETGMAGTDGTDIASGDVVECPDAIGQRFIDFNIARLATDDDENRPQKQYYPDGNRPETADKKSTKKK